MKIIKCGYCQKEYQKKLGEKIKSPKIGYLCSNCQKINPCGNPFCPPKIFHEH